MPSRVIIDTDPGVDDVLALLFALASSPDDLEVLLISVTHGNVDVQNCLRNVVSLFHIIAREIDWRRAHGKPEGFESLLRGKPLVALGAEEPLDDQRMLADYFHGIDGLGGVHHSHKHLSPPDTWKSLFAHEGLEPNDLGRSIKTADPVTSAPVWTETNPSLFQACQNPAHLEILRLLEENEPHTISVIAIGPLTNIALAASHAPKTLMRAKSIIVMGGTIDEPGNMSPLAEFNTFADSTAAARVYALTSPDPATTMPPFPPRRPLSEEDPGNDQGLLPPYPPKERFGSQRLHVTLFPLDITTTHEMKSDQFHRKVKPLLETGSPLAEWTTAFMVPTFRKMETLHSDGQRDGIAHLALHDPLCVWYALNGFSDPEAWILTKDEDIRVETTGQWTRGACITDKRDRKRSKDPDEEVEGDTDGWLSAKTGNRLQRCIATPGAALLGDLILDTVFGK